MSDFTFIVKHLTVWSVTSFLYQLDEWFKRRLYIWNFNDPELSNSRDQAKFSEIPVRS